MNLYGINEQNWSCDLDRAYFTGAPANSPVDVGLYVRGVLKYSFEVYADSSGKGYLCIRDIMESLLWKCTDLKVSTNMGIRLSPVSGVPLEKHFMVCFIADPVDSSMKAFAESSFLSTAPQGQVIAKSGIGCYNQVVMLDHTGLETDVRFLAVLEYLEDGVLKQSSMEFQLGDPFENILVFDLFFTMNQFTAASGIPRESWRSLSVSCGQRRRLFYFTPDKDYWEFFFYNEFFIPEWLYLPAVMEESTKLSSESVVSADGYSSVADIKIEDSMTLKATVDVPTAMWIRRVLRSKEVYVVPPFKLAPAGMRQVYLSSAEVTIKGERSAEIKLSLIARNPGHAAPPGFSDGLSPDRIFSSHFSSHFS